MFLFLCSFSIAFWGCLVLFYFCLRFIKNFQIIREEFPFFSQFFTIHLNCCGGLDIVRNPGGRHTQALVGYATLPRFCTKLCLQGFFAWRNRLLCAVHGAYYRSQKAWPVAISAIFNASEDAWGWNCIKHRLWRIAWQHSVKLAFS